ncbi:MAG: translation elongation factor 4 [Thermaerobacter sp.]|nr:translation elongation factor 4 [Thermaerobacter sp.]
MKGQQDQIRNFCIIAHIDHGKSTLADRLIEATGTLAARDMQEQVLDSMELERERGITIKAQAVRLDYAREGGERFELNLIDTPGHVDFSYEVSRSLAACEGALLVIDAAQGVEAQTLANLYLALEHDLEIIPVINKIDLPQADPDRVRRELQQIGIDPATAVLASAKEGTGIGDILEAIVDRVPPPSGDEAAVLQALVFDSHFDPYRGVVCHVRLVAGSLRLGARIRLMATGAAYEVTDLGTFRPAPTAADALETGEVGYFAAGIKNVRDARVGDTVTTAERGATQPLPGYRPAVPMVFAGLYPSEPSRYDVLREALERLQLNDAALSFEPETSGALGFGFRCGFLGLLHLEIVQERLEREYDMDLVVTAPSVVYTIHYQGGVVERIENPAALQPERGIEEIEEPYVEATVIAPTGYIGPAMELCQERRGQFKTIDYPSPDRAVLTYFLPLGEIMYDFFDQLKSRTRGYASLDYQLIGERPGDLVRVDVLLNNEVVDALSFIVHRDQAASQGRAVCEKLREVIPRQLFDVPIQAAVGGRVLARETIRALRKDVLAKCYGGDISRKRKLLEKQKEGKKRMRRLGQVEVPQEAFMAVLRRGD